MGEAELHTRTSLAVATLQIKEHDSLSYEKAYYNGFYSLILDDN
jgi:hypothetical protein